MTFRKKILSVVFAVLFFMILVLCVKGYTDFNFVHKGTEYYDSEQCSFSLTDLGNYNSVFYQTSKSGDFLFNSTGSMFVADYDDSEFDKQLAVLDKYKYVDDVVMFDESKFIIPSPVFDIGNWNFKIIADTDYPNTFDFISVNKTENKIAYLTFQDQDLDYLCKSQKSKNYMQKFIKKQFKYDFEN